MKYIVLLALVWYVSYCCSAAVPRNQQYRLKRKVGSGSESGENLLETTTKEETTTSSGSVSTSASQTLPRSTNATTTPKGEVDIAIDTVVSSTDSSISESHILFPSLCSSETKLGQGEEALPPLHADEFKVQILGPTKTDRELPFIKTPDVYVLKVPHFIIVKESDFLRNQDFEIPALSDSFFPFQEIPSLTQDFSIDSSPFGISGSHPIYPLEISQIVDHSPIISIGDSIPGISDFEGITGGVEILNPEPVNTEQHDDQIVNHETESISVEALNLFNDNKQLKNATYLSEKNKNKEN